MTGHRAALGVARACAVFIALRASGAAADPSATNNVQDVPAVVQFKNRDVYRGDVRVEYGDRERVPSTEDATVSFRDKKSRKSGFIVVPSGRGTFTSKNGLVFSDTSFVDGQAYGHGTLTVPSARGAAVESFDGIFVAGSPWYGTVRYADRATYAGYLADGCYAAAPASPPSVPADAPPGIDLGLPASPVADVYTGPDGMTVTGTWRHVAGAPCAASTVANARVAYEGGDAYLGDLAAAGRYVGFGAFYAHGPASDVLLCGTRPLDALYGPGTYVATFGRFELEGADANAVCRAHRDGVTTMTIVVANAESELDGTGTVRFANGDRADGPVHAGVLDGRGRYRPASYAATISGTFRGGRLSDAATLTDECGRSYPVAVRDGIVRNSPRAGARIAYLFRGCDYVELAPGATLAAGTVPSGYATEHLEGGETIAALWQSGRPSGHVVVRVRRPYVAVIDIPRARDSGVRITGKATIRFANGDVARGMLDAPIAEVSALEGPGAYTFASSGCTARGTFHAGRLRGSAVLLCPHEAPYVGVVGSDGTVQ